LQNFNQQYTENTYGTTNTEKYSYMFHCKKRYTVISSRNTVLKNTFKIKCV